MEIAEHIAVIEAEGILFSDAAAQGGLDVGVSACPDWDMRLLVRHLSEIHLLAIHRVDAQQAIGSITDLDADFAADGIDELLMGFAPRATTFPLAADRSMLVHTTDTGNYWHTTMGPNGIDTTTEERPADVTLSGRAEDLYLSLWNRGDGGSLEVGGDHDVLATWHAHFRIQWDL